MKLLIVDDEDRLLKSMQKLLKRNGYDAEIATSGEKCLDILKKETVDVVVLDIKMPGIGGLETLKLIKKFFPTVKVIILTGHGTGEYAVDALACGAADFLLKPVSPPEMIRRVEDALAGKRAVEEKTHAAQSIPKGCQEPGNDEED